MSPVVKKLLIPFFVCMLFAGAKVRAQVSQPIVADTVVQLTIGSQDAYFTAPMIVNLYKKNNKVVAVYSQADTTDRVALRKDPDFKRVSDIAFEGIKNRDFTKLKESTELAKKYQRVFRDTVITYSDSLLNAINNVVTKSNEELERNEINKHRIVLDGFSTSFAIFTSGNTRTVYAGTPTVSSHPALYRLIKQTFNVFRLEKRKFYPRGLLY